MGLWRRWRARPKPTVACGDHVLVAGATRTFAAIVSVLNETAFVWYSDDDAAVWMGSEKYTEEGTAWVFGWTGDAADAFRAAVALTR